MISWLISWLTGWLSGLSKLIVQVYSGLYVNEAADLDDEDFEDLDQPQVVSTEHNIWTSLK